MKALHYSIVSEKMVWIWYYDDLGAKHLKQLLSDDALAFARRMNATQGGGSGMIGTDFLNQYQTTNETKAY